MAHTHAGLDYRHLGVLYHIFNETSATPWDEHVQVLRQVHQLCGTLAGGVGDQGHAVPGQAGGFQGVPHDGDKGLVGVKGLFAAPENDGVARLQAEGGGVHSDVGPGLIDDANDTQRHPALADDQAVGPGGHLGGLTDGIGKGGHLPHTVHDTCDAGAVQRQPVLEGGAHSGGFGGGHIFLVGGQNLLLAGLQSGGNGLQGGVLLAGARNGEHPAGIFGGQTLHFQLRHNLSLLLCIRLGEGIQRAAKRVPMSAPFTIS